MRFVTSLVIFCSAVGVAGSPALADTCLDRFKYLMSAPDWDTPARNKFTSQINDGAISSGETLYSAWDHQLTVQGDPNLPQSLNYKGGIYLSYDQGNSWQKVNAIDAEQSRIDTLAGLKQNAETATNVTCREAQLDDQVADVLEGDLANIWPVESKAHYVLYVEKGSNFIVKNEATVNINESITSIVVNNIERVNAPELPVPEK